jgi:hypothetical protein
MGEIEGRAVNALPVARDQVDALPDRRLDPKGATPAWYSRAALEHVNGTQVERRRRPLGIQEPSVAR